MSSCETKTNLVIFSTGSMKSPFFAPIKTKFLGSFKFWELDFFPKVKGYEKLNFRRITQLMVHKLTAEKSYFAVSLHLIALFNVKLCITQSNRVDYLDIDTETRNIQVFRYLAIWLLADFAIFSGCYTNAQFS